MGRVLELPRAIAQFGGTVQIHPTFAEGGSAVFSPGGAVGHHTVSNPPANAPSLRVVAETGRPDLAAPLANDLIARDGTNILTASGRANHAGSGSWRGLVGNTSVLGYEVENTGTGEIWSERLIMHGYVTGVAGGLAMIGRDAGWFCRHAEWAGHGNPVGARKIDPWGPWWDGHRWEIHTDHFREIVQITLNTGGLDMDTLGLWMQQQATRVINTLTAVVNGRRSDSLFVVKPRAQADRPSNTWLYDGSTRRRLEAGSPATSLYQRRFGARVVLLSPAEMAVFKANAPKATTPAG